MESASAIVVNIFIFEWLPSDHIKKITLVIINLARLSWAEFTLVDTLLFRFNGLRSFDNVFFLAEQFCSVKIMRIYYCFRTSIISYITLSIILSITLIICIFLKVFRTYQVPFNYLTSGKICKTFSLTWDITSRKKKVTMQFFALFMRCFLFLLCRWQRLEKFYFLCAHVECSLHFTLAPTTSFQGAQKQTWVYTT